MNSFDELFKSLLNETGKICCVTEEQYETRCNSQSTQVVKTCRQRPLKIKSLFNLNEMSKSDDQTI